jgi:hypothetical protein
MHVSAPRGTKGEIAVPVTARSIVRVNGKRAWDGRRGRLYRARRAGGYVHLEGVPGGAYSITAAAPRV